MPDRSPRPGAFRALGLAMRSWRTASVALLSFSSGMPLGLIWIALPDWMRSIGVDIKTVGLLTLTQAPWTFKFLWAPLMDRWAPGFWGRRRGWIAVTQVALFAVSLWLAGLGDHPDTPWVVGAVALVYAFAAASQDIAYDGWTVDVLRPEEQGVAVSARVAMYRAAMLTAGGLAITLAAQVGWRTVNAGLGVLFLLFLFITWKAPEPETPARAPLTLRAAVWEPFLGFLGRPRALEILTFLICYKLADNIAQALQRPFLIDMGYGATDRGVALATIGNAATIGGTVLGGLLTTSLGLGRALWIFGAIQILSNLGYVLVGQSEVDRWLMYSALGFESFTQGLGTGAFSVLLIRLTQKRFSVTQYALFSSLFGVSRLLSGPIAGGLVDAMGWVPFFWLTMAIGIPGLVLLARFVPWHVRDPVFEDQEVAVGRVASPRVAARLVVGALAGTAVGFVLKAALNALRATRGEGAGPFDLGAAASAILDPQTPAAWIEPVGIVVFGVVCGLFAAAIAMARREGAAAAS
jgi:PAT family beta-lactamase induction signal transducer AmpG